MVRLMKAFGFLPPPELYELPLGLALLGVLIAGVGLFAGVDDVIGFGVLWTVLGLLALLYVAAWRGK
jgi:hypothetical protein